MKIAIDRANCVGHARCAAAAPELFALDADGYISTDGFDVPDGQETLAKRGSRACPERLISVSDEPAADQQGGMA